MREKLESLWYDWTMRLIFTLFQGHSARAKRLLACLIVGLALAACQAGGIPTDVAGAPDASLAAPATHSPEPALATPPEAMPEATLPALLLATTEVSPPATSTPTRTTAPTETPSPTSTPTETPQPTPTASGTPTLTPTYAILRGEVLQRSNCRYGPGWMYLYKYGLVVGSNLEVFGRNDLGTWILIRAIGGDNPCWVKASLLDVKGDVMAVQPTYIPLPQSPYYGPPTGVSAVRAGDEVTVSWNPISFRAGDDHASPPYLLEAWTCIDGELIFTPVGSYTTSATVIDEPGCAEESHGRVFGVEKHGYTRWVEVPWP